MIGQCPRCQVRLVFPESGRFQCDRCRTQFDVYVAPPRAARARAAGGGLAAQAPPGVPGFTPGPAVEGRCATHPNNPAQDVCERCGDFMCPVCQTVVEGRRYCPRCFDLLYARGSLQFTQRAFNLPAYAMTLGLLSTLSLGCLGCYGLFSMPTGVIGVILGANALREIGKRPDLPGRRLALSGIIFGAIGAAVTLVGWIVLAVLIFNEARKGG
jgi:hypothetical protein